MRKLVILFLLIGTFSFSQTAFELQKLEDFAKLYGIVRYFHPSDEAAQLDWNAFAVYGVEEILKTKNKKDFEKKIKELFSPIAPSMSFTAEQYQWDTLSLYPVYWKHTGLGLGNVNSFYKSNRINALKNKQADFSAVGINIFDKILMGKNLKLQYKAKAIGGKAYGYFKIADHNDKSLFFKNHYQEPVISENWEIREFIIPAISDYKEISLGFISKQGTSIFKDIKLFYKENNNSWKEYFLPNFISTKWYPIQKPELKRAEKEITIIDSNILTHPDINWKPYYMLGLLNNLTADIPIVVYTNGERTLPVTDSLKLNQLNKNIEKANLTNFNQNIALANLIMTWNIFRHFYPYQDEIRINWDLILKNGLAEVYTNKIEEDHLLSLRKFTTVFQDGHIRVFNPKIQDIKAYALPISWKWIENNLVVNKVMNGTVGIEKGDIVQRINGQTAKNYIDSTAQYISGSKQWKQWTALQEGLKGKKGSKQYLTLKNGKIIDLSREIVYSKNYDFYSREDTIMFNELNNNILFLNLDKITKYQFYQQYNKIKSFCKVILDLRGYPNKGVNEILTNFFYNKSNNEVFFKPLIREPEFKDIEWEGGRWLYKFTDSLQAKIVLLVDERSISYAESVSSYLKENNYVTIIGRPTAGANGNVNKIKLTGNFFITFTGMKVRNPDGSQFHTIGVLPDVYVEETLEDIKQGKDPFIEKAVEILNIK